MRYLGDSWKNPEEFSTLRIPLSKNRHCRFLPVLTFSHVEKVRTKSTQLEGSTLKLQFSIKGLDRTCKVMSLKAEHAQHHRQGPINADQGVSAKFPGNAPAASTGTTL